MATRPRLSKDTTKKLEKVAEENGFGSMDRTIIHLYEQSEYE